MITPSGLVIARDRNGNTKSVPWESLADDTEYYSVNETIGVDTNYVVGFRGCSMILYTSKACIVRLNSLGNDPIPLPARIGISFNDMVIDSVHLSSVLAGTDVQMVVTGNI